MITLLCGKAKESIPYGILYARLRSFAAPFALPTIVAQAAFLAVKDAVTPLKAVLVGAAVNVVGDLLCVSVLNMGVRGDYQLFPLYFMWIFVRILHIIRCCYCHHSESGTGNSLSAVCGSQKPLQS